MTEPEELEEDLFADLYGAPLHHLPLKSLTSKTHRYDADDTTNHATSAAEAPRVSQSTVSAVTQPVDTPVTQSEAIRVDAEDVKDPYQMPENEGVYQNGGGNLDAGLVPTASTADAEPHGTGIKEDG